MTQIKHVAFPIKRNGTTPKVYDANGKYLFWISLSSESNALEELREKGESWLDFRNRTDPMREALADEEFKVADFIVTAVNAYDKQRALIKTLTAALDECEDYFDNRADADCDQDGFIPNNEMQRLTTVRDALAAAKKDGF